MFEWSIDWLISKNGQLTGKFISQVKVAKSQPYFPPPPCTEPLSDLQLDYKMKNRRVRKMLSQWQLKLVYLNWWASLKETL